MVLGRWPAGGMPNGTSLSGASAKYSDRRVTEVAEKTQRLMEFQSACELTDKHTNLGSFASGVFKWRLEVDSSLRGGTGG